MALNATATVRVFTYNGVEIPDPAAAMSIEDVRDLLSATYPELTTAAIQGPEVRGNRLVYSFQKAVGTKG